MGEVTDCTAVICASVCVQKLRAEEWRVGFLGHAKETILGPVNYGVYDCQSRCWYILF